LGEPVFFIFALKAAFMDQGTIEVERFVYETDILFPSASELLEGVSVFV